MTENPNMPAAAGLKFDVSSEHGHETPLSAALECLERVRKAVAR